MVSGWRLMPAIKFIDSPVDLGSCQLDLQSGPRGATGPSDGLIIEETPKRAPGVGQESNLLIIGETIERSKSRQDRVGQGSGHGVDPIFAST